MSLDNDYFEDSIEDNIIDEADVPYDMQERAGDLEARRLLAHLDYAKIDDSVCDDSNAMICNLLSMPWNMCDKTETEVLTFLTEQKAQWANDGFRIVIEGGTEKNRRRVMNFCMYMGIISRLQSFTYIAKTYDWQSILPVIGDFKHDSKHSIIESMRTIEVLGITEIDLAQPREMGGIETTLTSILRSRWLAKKPTIITLKRPSYLKQNILNGEIGDLIKMKNSEEDMVIRLQLKEV